MTATLLDASALLAWFQQEPGADVVDQYLASSAISSVNLAEVLYKLADRGVDPRASANDLRELGVASIPFNESHALAVARIRTTQRSSANNARPLSLADLCCIATAEAEQLTVLTCDREWEHVETTATITLVR